MPLEVRQVTTLAEMNDALTVRRRVFIDFDEHAPAYGQGVVHFGKGGDLAYFQRHRWRVYAGPLPTPSTLRCFARCPSPPRSGDALDHFCHAARRNCLDGSSVL